MPAQAGAVLVECGYGNAASSLKASLTADVVEKTVPFLVTEVGEEIGPLFTNYKIQHVLTLLIDKKLRADLIERAADSPRDVLRLASTGQHGATGALFTAPLGFLPRRLIDHATVTQRAFCYAACFRMGARWAELDPQAVHGHPQCDERIGINGEHLHVCNHVGLTVRHNQLRDGLGWRMAMALYSHLWSCGAGPGVVWTEKNNSIMHSHP